jgi:hypothetical protein
LFSVLAMMFVQGVSTRRIKKVTEELCRHGFSGSTVSAIKKTTLDATLTHFVSRSLEEAFPYLIFDARYEIWFGNSLENPLAALLCSPPPQCHRSSNEDCREEACLKELRRLNNRYNLPDAQEGLSRWIDRCQEGTSRFVEWVEEPVWKKFTFLNFRGEPIIAPWKARMC